MSKISIVEDGKITYRGKLPTNFRNSNMNCTGLDKATQKSLLAKGILPLEIVPPVYDSTTHKIEGFTDTIQKGKVVQAWNIVERTQADADNDLDSEYREKIEDEKEKMAINSLISKEELPADYLENKSIITKLRM